MYRAAVFPVLSFILSGPPSCHAEDIIYKSVKSNGEVTFTNKPVNDTYVKLEKHMGGWQAPFDQAHYIKNKTKFKPIIDAASTRYKISTHLIDAIIHAESYYDPKAISRAGAVGLMQLMPETAKRFGVTNRQDPKQNINAGVKYFNELMEMFNDNVYLALAAYNAGENAVIKYGNTIPPYKETQNYVRKVVKHYRKNKYSFH